MGKAEGPTSTSWPAQDVFYPIHLTASGTKKIILNKKLIFKIINEDIRIDRYRNISFQTLNWNGFHITELTSMCGAPTSLLTGVSVTTFVSVGTASRWNLVFCRISMDVA